MVIIDFFVEAFNRLKTKSPKFFSILQILGVAVIVLGHSPWVISRYTTWQMPQGFINLCSDIATRAEGFLLAAFFAIRTPTVAQTKDGEAIKVTDEKKMPLTAKDEEKAINKSNPEPPVIEDIDKIKFS